MELTLSHLTGSQIVVVCDQQFSHTFDLTPLLLEVNDGLVELSDDAVGYGDALYEALFAENTMAAHTLQARPARIVLIVPEEDLDRIPWEYVHGPTGFLALQYPFVRGLVTEQHPNPPVLNKADGLHIVAISANPRHPQTAEPISEVDEWQNLQEIVQEVTPGLTLERIHPPTIEQLQRLTAQQQKLVVHFAGYAEQINGAVRLYFEQKNGRVQYVSVPEFLASIAGKTLLVTLNACVTEDPAPTPFCMVASTLTQHAIPYALAIRMELDEEDASTFFYTLYDELAQGTPIETAVVTARSTLETTDNWSIGIPVLYTALKEPLPGFPSSSTALTIASYQPWNDIEALPRASEGQFQGRIPEMQMLTEKLSSASPWGLFTIQGPVGQGKTTLVREALERFAANWSGGIYVTRLENLTNKDTFLFELAHFLQLEVQPLVDYATLEQQALSLLSQHRTLIVLNHAELLLSPDHMHAELAYFIREQLLPTTQNMLLLSEVPLGWPGETVYQLRGLTPEDGAALLLQRAQQGPDKPTRSLLQQLSVMVDGHPLSLCLLGRTLPAEIRDLPAFIEAYTVHFQQAEQYNPEANHQQHAYYAALATSVDYLPAPSRRILQQLSVFHAPFAEEFAASVLDATSDPEVTDVVEHPLFAQFATLWEHGFLAREFNTGEHYTLLFYYLPPTIRLYLEQALPLVDAEREVLYQRMENVYKTLAHLVFAPTSSETLWLNIAAHALADLEHCSPYVVPAERPRHQLYLAWIFSCQGNRTRARELLADLLLQQEEQVMIMYTDYQFLKGASRVYIQTGSPRNALLLCEHALTIVQLRQNPATEAAILVDMAELMALYLAHPREALAYLEQAVKVFTVHNLSEDAHGRTLNNLEAQISELSTTDEAFEDKDTGDDEGDGEDDQDYKLHLPTTRAMAQEVVTAIYKCLSTDSRDLNTLRSVFKAYREILFLPAVEKGLKTTISDAQSSGNLRISNLLEERLLLIRACKDHDIDTIFDQLNPTR